MVGTFGQDIDRISYIIKHVHIHMCCGSQRFYVTANYFYSDFEIVFVFIVSISTY